MPRHPWIPDSIIRWLRGEKKKIVNIELDEDAWEYLEASAREEGLSIEEMAYWTLRKALETKSEVEEVQPVTFRPIMRHRFSPKLRQVFSPTMRHWFSPTVRHRFSATLRHPRMRHFPVSFR